MGKRARFNFGVFESGSLGLFTGAEREIRFQSKLINMQFVIPRHTRGDFFLPARGALPLFFRAHERRLKIHTAGGRLSGNDNI